MSLYRSQEMKLYRLGVKKDMIWEVINEFGKRGLAHFLDLNAEESPMNLPYTNAIKECEYAEKRLNYLRDQCVKHRVEVKAPATVDGMQEVFERYARGREKAESMIREHIQDEIRSAEKHCQEQNDKVKKTQDTYEQLKQSQAVFRMAGTMIPNLGRELVGGQPEAGAEGQQTALLDGAVDITHIAGVVAQEDIARLKRLIFRSTKGKSYVRVEEYFDAAPISSDKQVAKSVYIIMFWEGKQIRDKIEKICDTFNGQRFVLPPMDQLSAQINQVEGYIADAKANFDATRTNLREQLVAFNSSEHRGELERDGDAVSAIYIYKLFIAKEKAIFRTINMMRLRSGAEQFVGYFWCPSIARPDVEAIAQDSRFSNAIEPIKAAEGHKIEPPTHIPMTDVTWLSQNLVNLYGIPRYQEANPMIVSIVTFPFLFGMMFGDLGHGSLVGMVGLMAILQGEKGPLAKGRYPLFLMGLFAMYAGFTYNEVFALPINMFNSCYEMTGEGDSTLSGQQEFLNVRMTPSQSGFDHSSDNSSAYIIPRVNSNCTYLMGNDPAWGVTSNRLAMSNGVKMKMSVIFGVLHMMIGIIHKYTNTIFHGHWPHLITECIGGTIILLGLFGWMDMLVLNKWMTELDIDSTEQATIIAPHNYTDPDAVCPAKKDSISLLTQEQACPCWYNATTNAKLPMVNKFPSYQSNSTYSSTNKICLESPTNICQTIPANTETGEPEKIWQGHKGMIAVGAAQNTKVGTPFNTTVELDCIKACEGNATCISMSTVLQATPVPTWTCYQAAWHSHMGGVERGYTNDTDAPTTATWYEKLPYNDCNGTINTAKSMQNCMYKGDYKSSQMTNVINIMVTGAFKMGAIVDCAGDSTNIGYIGSEYNITTNTDTKSVITTGPQQSGMYSLGLGLLLTVVVLIPVYLFVVPCCFRNPDKEYNLDQIFEEDDAAAGSGNKDSNAIQNNSNVSIERGADNKSGGIAGVLKEMSTPYHNNTFGEAFIHQLIETIEFVLGTISNTASYLRLWALSLAHGQLSEVFFNLIVQNYVSIYKGVGTGGMATIGGATIPLTLLFCFILFPVFWSVTFAVIMCMDQMECFLHCLRLHWVEMQNKFFKGDGYEYLPLTTTKVLEQAKSD